jgi:hypothetical protein
MPSQAEPAAQAVAATPAAGNRMAPAPATGRGDSTPDATAPAAVAPAEPVAGTRSSSRLQPAVDPTTGAAPAASADTGASPSSVAAVPDREAGKTPFVPTGPTGPGAAAAQAEGVTPGGQAAPDASIPRTGAVALSPAQQDVIDYYGWPQTFSLMFYARDAGAAAVRHETWNYHAAGIAYTFVDGESGGLPTPLPDVPGAVYPDYRPTQFAAGMSVARIFNALPAVETYYQEQMPETGTSTYWVDRLVMGFVDAGLVYVETRPQLPATTGASQ